jgi:octaprenyl-diphosphate synthase
METRTRLAAICTAHGVEPARAALELVAAPLAALDGDLAALAAGASVAAGAARHLVRAGGKRVRPAVCLLAAAAAGGAPPGEPARLVATIAEAIHAATLLHDDVIDLGDTRRGAAAARVVYGNAASVLGGDLLLARALALVEQAATPGLLASVVDVLARMIDAEALQLERRGSAALTAEEYFAIALGKTAALFEWAAGEGARAATGREDERVQALRLFGRELGVAFQVADDLIDLRGDPALAGKGLLADVREGKVTFPLIGALRADPGLAGLLEAAACGEAVDEAGLGRRARRAAEAGGGITAARAEVARRTAAAVAALAHLPRSAAREGLAALARSLEERAR